MNLEAVERIARAVLYEGFLLYPYTASSLKNQQRFNFGVLHPPTYDTSEMQMECLVRGLGEIDIRVRFLQRDAEHEIVILGLSLPGRQTKSEGNAFVSVETAPLQRPVLHRLTVQIRNLSTAVPNARQEAIDESMVSTHAILNIRGGEFISLMDPPPEYKELVAECRNIGCFPVLVGNEGERDAMLASPIILYDYPQVAAESPGDLFDGAEIDEILTLRILTLSESEKEEIRKGDARGREILERSEGLQPEHLMKLHGAVRSLRPHAATATEILVRVGDRVRLRPRRRADILDIALQGKLAIVEAVERDYEGRLHVAVVLEDDPGRDLGLARQPGHRFFFTLEEVERVG